MSNSAKSKVTNLFTLLVLLLTTFQGLIPALPMGNTVVISAVVMFLVSGITAWKQYLSIEINNAGLTPTLFVAIIATIGGINDLLNVFPLSNTAGQWVRFGITFLTAFINLASKLLWPTNQTKTNI
jgi:hypothetical protein